MYITDLTHFLDKSGAIGGRSGQGMSRGVRPVKGPARAMAPGERAARAILDIDEHGVLDVERWNAQQLARVGDPLAPERPARGSMPQIIDAASRFIARVGSLAPDQTLLHRIEEAVLQKLVCPRVEMVR